MTAISAWAQENCGSTCTTVEPESFTTENVEICAQNSGREFDFSVCQLPTIPPGNEISHYSFFWDFGDGQFAITHDLSEIKYTYSNELETSTQAYVQVTSVYTDDRLLHPDSAKKMMRPGGITSVSISPEGTTNSASGLADCDGTQLICMLDLNEHELGILPVRSLVPNYPMNYILAISDDLWNSSESKMAYFDFQSADYFHLPDAWAYDANYEQIKLGEQDDNRFNFDLGEFNFPENSENNQHYIFLSIEADEELIELDSVYFHFGFAEQEILFAQHVSKEHDPNFKRVEPLFVCDGQTLPTQITYTVGFTNEGDQPADSINIMDHLPDGLLDYYSLDTNSINVVISNRKIRHKSQVNDLSSPLYNFQVKAEDDLILWRLRGILLMGEGMQNESLGIEADFKDVLGRIQYKLVRKDKNNPDMGMENLLTSYADIKFGELDKMTTGLGILRQTGSNCCDLQAGNQNYLDINLLEITRQLLSAEKFPILPLFRVRDPMAGLITLRKNNFRKYLDPQSYRYRFPEPYKPTGEVQADTLIFWAVQPPAKNERSGEGVLENSFTRYHQIALRICRTPQQIEESPIPVWLAVSLAALAVLLLLLLFSFRRRRI